MYLQTPKKGGLCACSERFFSPLSLRGTVRSCGGLRSSRRTGRELLGAAKFRRPGEDALVLREKKKQGFVKTKWIFVINPVPCGSLGGLKRRATGLGPRFWTRTQDQEAGASLGTRKGLHFWVSGFMGSTGAFGFFFQPRSLITLCHPPPPPPR